MLSVSYPVSDSSEIVPRLWSLNIKTNKKRFLGSAR